MQAARKVEGNIICLWSIVRFVPDHEVSLHRIKGGAAPIDVAKRVLPPFIDALGLVFKLGGQRVQARFEQ